MIEKIFHSILLRRHFWRHATFSEVAELYASRMLRMFAMHIASAFMSIYLFQQGYSVFFIAVFWAMFYVFKAMIALICAGIAARLGPKHAILLSNILYIPSMIAFALVPEYGSWLLGFVILFQGVSSTLYSIAYSIDFSKVKSVEHAGKEIAYMNIVEKVTTGISPLIGGIIAYIMGPQVVLVIAAILFLVAAGPLFKSAEPEPPHQRLNFKGFPWRLVRPSIASQIALGFDVFTSGTVWTLFTAIFILGVSQSNEIYATNGALISVVLFAALGASYAYGKLIDGKKGKELLQFTSIANSITHFIRPFTTNAIGIAGLNIANEAATTGYTMAYTRGIFDNADLSGQRTTYIGIVEVLSNLGAAIAAGVLALLVSFMSDQNAMAVFFYVAAGVVLLTMTARFPLYRKK